MFESPFLPSSLLDPIVTSSTFLTGSNNNQLYLHSHPVESPRAGLALIHGLGEHAGRYTSFYQLFNKLGISVYALDYEGHGKTLEMNGAKGRTRVAVRYNLIMNMASKSITSLQDLTTMLMDTEKLIAYVRNQIGPSKKIFVFGHSMGGLTSIYYTLRAATLTHAPRVDGLIVSSPQVKAGLPVRWWEYYGGKLVAQVFPGMPIDNKIDASTICKNAEAIRNFQDDNLCHGTITAGLAVDLIDGGEAMIEDVKEFPNIPIFILHGSGDRICLPEASKAVFDRLPNTDKKYTSIPGALHEWFRDEGSEPYIEEIRQWLDSHI